VKPNKVDVGIRQNDSPVQNKVIKRNTSPSVDSKPSKKKIKVIKNPLPVTKPFGHLLDGVIFTMSGYENPYRSNLRSKALEMGAIYKNNWDQSCTHLICAFINTPKYNEAKRQGAYRVVKSDWIDKCYSNKCRFPWRRFALDKSEQNKPESEDEIHELTESVETNDSDDEWNDNPVRSPVPSTSTSLTNILENQQNSIFDADTDIDSDAEAPSDIDILADEKDIPLPIIENVFRNCSFYLSTKLKPLIKKECYRYIIALEGKLSTKDKCDYIVSTDANNLKHKNAVTPQWIWDCYDANKILPLK